MKNTHFIITVIILSFSFFWGCSESKLKKHLKEIQKQNNKVMLDGWEVVQQYSFTPSDENYVLKQMIGDTTIYFSFSYLNEGEGKYTINNFEKSYYKNNYYYEIVLQNSDTIYFFKCDSLLKNKPGFYYCDITKLDFYIGKYYYLFMSNRMKRSEQKYFVKNSDSLIKIKGNNTPELPKINMSDNDFFKLSEKLHY